jgi:hypothetical protein
LPVSAAERLPRGVTTLPLVDPPSVDVRMVWRPSDAPLAVHQINVPASTVYHIDDLRKPTVARTYQIDRPRPPQDRSDRAPSIGAGMVEDRLRTV